MRLVCIVDVILKMNATMNLMLLSMMLVVITMLLCYDVEYNINVVEVIIG